MTNELLQEHRNFATELGNISKTCDELRAVESSARRIALGKKLSLGR
jgi:hypothetical protein